MENLLYFTNVITSEDWLTMAIGRAGTGVLHMFGAGLVGWGLARAWRKGKWPFLALMVALAVFTHGLWNALALVAGLGSELVIGVELNLGQQILNYLPLLFLLLVQLLVLLLINRRLRKSASCDRKCHFGSG